MVKTTYTLIRFHIFLQLFTAKSVVEQEAASSEYCHCKHRQTSLTCLQVTDWEWRRNYTRPQRQISLFKSPPNVEFPRKSGEWQEFSLLVYKSEIRACPCGSGWFGWSSLGRGRAALPAPIVETGTSSNTTIITTSHHADCLYKL